MENLQNNLETEILKVGYDSLFLDLQKNINSKVKFINSLKEKELTEQSLSRINAEESHIEKIVAFQMASKDLIDSLQKTIQKLSVSATYWHRLNQESIEENIQLSKILIASYGRLSENK